MTRIAIVQSNYLPWKGYFDLIASVDEFVLYDDMQYTRRDWRNRNKIKTPQGTQWLTVPVLVKGKYHQSIFETQISGAGWAADHWKAIELNYRKARHFDEIADWMEPMYRGDPPAFLSELNRRFIERICRYLEIGTTISSSRDYDLAEGKSERLAELCLAAGGTGYVSGPAAKGYLDEEVFAARGLTLHWFDYDGYPEYDQLWGGFVHAVSVIDLLMNCGRDARAHMRRDG